MLIIPAIDLLDGKCVRLYKGEYDKSQVYNENPVEMAKIFVSAGAKLIHIVDLDAARGGKKNNRDKIRQILQEISIPIEVGGGIRTLNDVDELVKLGVNRLILGTVLVKQPKEVASWVKKYPHVQFIAGIDALNGEVKVNGWEEGSSMEDVELAKYAKAIGMAGLVYTNISRDGTLTGPDIESSEAVAKAAAIPLIVSGGVSSIGDIKKISEKNQKYFWGTIVGKAYYEGKLDLSEAIAKYQR